MGINRNKVLANAQKHVHKGNWDKAIAQYQQLVDDDPRDVRSLLKIADLYSKLGRGDEALAGYQRVAKHYASDEIYEKAAAVYKQALRLAPESPDLHRDLGDAYHSLGRLKDAVRAYHKAQKIYKANGDGARQSEVLERMIALDADDIGMRIQLAERYAKDNKKERALELFEFAAERLDQEGRSDEFVQVAERIIFLRGQAPALRQRVIDIYLSRGQYRHALSHLQVGFKREPQNLQILEQLAQAFEHLERENKAVMVLHEMANQQDAQGNEDACVRIYKRILALTPDDARARRRLKKIRALSDSGALSGSPSTGALKPRTQTPISTAQSAEPDADALAGIEFLDDMSGVEFLDEPAAAKVRAPRAVAEPTDAVDEPIDISNEIEAIEPVAPTIERGGTGTGASADADFVAGVLKETDVFIKYGLFDKAYETIVGVIARQPDSLHAHAQMARLQEARNNPEGAVDEFLEMARITRATPARAEKFMREAFALTRDSERVRRQAEQMGIPLASAQPAKPISPLNPALGDEAFGSLEENTSIDPDSQARSPGELAAPDYPTDEFDEDDDFGGSDASHTDRMEVTDDMLAMNLGDLQIIDDAGAPFEEPGTQELDLDDEDLFLSEEPVEPTQDTLLDAHDIAVDLDDADLVDAEFIDLDIEEHAFSDAEFINAEMIEDDIDIDDFEEQEFEELDFDESAFEDAEFLEMDVDVAGLSELSDSQVGALQDVSADAAQEQDFDLSVSGDEADQMFDQLFGESGGLGGGGFGGHGELSSNPDAQADAEQLEELDFLAPPQPDERSGPNLQRSSDSQTSNTSGLQVPHNAFGARSLSGKFAPAAEFEQSQGLGLGESEAHNTSLELGIAYRDMGLIEEAIFEFKQALDDPDAVNAANYHIALCELEAGKQSAGVERLKILLQQTNLSAKLRDAAREQLQGTEA